MIAKSRTFSLLTLGLALATVSASASTLYDYTGNNYTSADGATYTTSMNLTGSFTIGAPLGDNLSNVDISSDILSWQFNDGLLTWSSASSSLTTAVVSTDSSGTIDDWDFLASLVFPPYYVALGSEGPSGTSPGDGVIAYYEGYYPEFYGSNASPGVWSEASPVPEPPIVSELALGLFVLASLAIVGKSRRRPGRSLTAAA